MSKGSPSVKILWKKVPLTILAAFWPPKIKQMPIWTWTIFRCASISSLYTCQWASGHWAEFRFWGIWALNHVILKSCHLVVLSPCHLVIMSSCPVLVLLLSCQHAIMSSGHYVILSSFHLYILTSCHYVILPRCPLVSLSSCHHVTMPSCHHVILELASMFSK